MKINKRYLLILSFVVLLSSLSLTYAYFIVQENNKTIITFGNIKLKLEEKTLEDGKYVNVKDNDSIDITHVDKLSRSVKVKNVGNNPFYLRLEIKFSGVSKGNKVINGDRLIMMDIDEKWEYKDGYYYYKTVLNPNEETTELMKEISFDNENILENYRGSKFKLEINAQAVQSDNNGKNVFEATGWPK